MKKTIITIGIMALLLVSFVTAVVDDDLELGALACVGSGDTLGCVGTEEATPLITPWTIGIVALAVILFVRMRNKKNGH